MAGSGLSDEAAEDKGLIKNHWMWRFLVKGTGNLTGQIQFGFNLKETPSLPSTLAAATGLSTPTAAVPVPFPLGASPVTTVPSSTMLAALTNLLLCEPKARVIQRFFAP